MATMMPEPVLLLRALLAPADCAALAAAFDPGRLLTLLANQSPALRADGPLAALAASRLGAGCLCNLDQCFLRHQYAPARRPPDHPPHSWHQDGALGHDYTRHADADGGLLDMITCWVALTRCGASHAPALEWVLPSPSRLLAVHELTDAAVAARLAGAAPEAAPLLEPGDALVFDGALLHRTQVRPEMVHDRISAELRLFAAPPPARLAGQRFVPLHARAAALPGDAGSGR